MPNWKKKFKTLKADFEIMTNLADQNRAAHRQDTEECARLFVENESLKAENAMLKGLLQSPSVLN